MEGQDNVHTYLPFLPSHLASMGSHPVKRKGRGRTSVPHGLHAHPSTLQSSRTGPPRPSPSPSLVSIHPIPIGFVEPIRTGIPPVSPPSVGPDVPFRKGVLERGIGRGERKGIPSRKGSGKGKATMAAHSGLFMAVGDENGIVRGAWKGEERRHVHGEERDDVNGGERRR